MNDHLPLVHAIIDALLFFESAGSDEVNPDSAVRCMENMTSSIQSLQIADQQSLRKDMAKIAQSSDDSAFKSFVESVPEMLGLAE